MKKHKNTLYNFQVRSSVLVHMEEKTLLVHQATIDTIKQGIYFQGS